MKKILLSLGLFSLVLVGRSQVVLNEVYTEPGAGKQEFFELYNSSAAGSQNLDCFTLVTYWESGANKGWYVIDLPNLSVASKSFFTGASSDPFAVQAQTGVDADFSWNDAAFLTANNGYLKSYQLNGAGTGYNAPTTPASLNDLFYKANIGGVFYVTYLFQNGVLINGFLGGDADGILHADLQALPDLGIDMSGLCTDFTIDFSALGTVEFVNQAPGNDNGFARTCDGKCGAWSKTAPGVSHTPGVTNGSASTGDCAIGAMVTAESISCNTSPRFVLFDITGLGTGGATEADDFPIEVTVYADLDGDGELDGTDPAINATPKIQATVASPSDTVQINFPYHNSDVIVVYKTKRGCFDKVQPVPNACIILPVNLKSFTAVRNQTNVILRWESMTEQNNTGFAVERKTSGGWEQVAFIPSQALNGNSNSLLSYSYIDANAFKGISQYRIRQVDFDNRSTTSEIKAVRGESIKTQLLVYPNPSNNGMVNVVFEDASAIRDVSLSDMAGRTVRQMTGITNNNIQFENLMPGVYSLRVIDRGTGEQNVQKIVVNKR